MALTRSFKDTVKARAERDPAFRDALLTEAVDQFLAGDVEARTNETPILIRISGQSWNRVA